jgi:hypothetical protein
MQKLIELANSAATLLDDIGGEPLTGSGFETELPEAEFDAGELIRMEPHAPEEE